jgi:hypothetical protein
VTAGVRVLLLLLLLHTSPLKNTRVVLLLLHVVQLFVCSQAASCSATLTVSTSTPGAGVLGDTAAACQLSIQTMLFRYFLLKNNSLFTLAT